MLQTLPKKPKTPKIEDVDEFVDNLIILSLSTENSLEK